MRGCFAGSPCAHLLASCGRWINAHSAPSPLHVASSQRPRPLARFIPRPRYGARSLRLPRRHSPAPGSRHPRRSLQQRSQAECGAASGCGAAPPAAGGCGEGGRRHAAGRRRAAARARHPACARRGWRSKQQQQQPAAAADSRLAAEPGERASRDLCVGAFVDRMLVAVQACGCCDRRVALHYTCRVVIRSTHSQPAAVVWRTCREAPSLNFAGLNFAAAAPAVITTSHQGCRLAPSPHPPGGVSVS